MQTLTYGYQLPEDQDKGPIVFPALELNIQQLNDHSHDGINSTKLDRKALDSIKQALAAVNWVSVGGGLYRQAVTMPAGLTYGTLPISAIFHATGHAFYPTIEKIDGTHFYIYINDNSLAICCVNGCFANSLSLWIRPFSLSSIAFSRC